MIDNLFNLLLLQAHLRAFIPEMLKYSTGRSKPGWGKAEFRPVWWPNDVPWANIRMDMRTEETKKRVSVCIVQLYLTTIRFFTENNHY